MECNSDQNFIAISGFKMSEKYLNTDKDKTLVFFKPKYFIDDKQYDELMSTKDKKF